MNYGSPALPIARAAAEGLLCLLTDRVDAELETGERERLWILARTRSIRGRVVTKRRKGEQAERG